MNAQTELTAAEKLAAFIAEYGLTMEATFVPYSKAKERPGWSEGVNGKPWRGLSWSVKILRNGREVLTTDYSAGEAWAPSYKASAEKVKRAANFLHLSDGLARLRMIDWELEHGKAVSSTVGGAFHGREPINPQLADILYSLALDAGAIEHPTFESWAEDFGYETDSRTAEATYRACLEIGLKLRAGLGEDGLSALRDAAQDY